MTKRNIILFSEAVHQGGGTERVLVNLANSLSENGYRVTVLAKTVGEKQVYEMNKQIILRKYKFGSFKNTHAKNIILKIINKFFGPYILENFLSKYIRSNTDLIISFSAGITNYCFRTKHRNKVISFEHWPYRAYDNNPKVQNQIKKNYPLLKKVIVLTEHERNVYAQMGCNVILIPNAYSFFPETAAVLQNKKVLSVGHFNAAKRRDLLLDAWKHVSQKHPDWELIIVGDGPEKENCIKQINDLSLSSSVTITDPTKNIINHYLNASVFVLSSELETLPMVLIEARASGLPCVSFDIICGPKEIINDSIDGFIVPFPDTQKMSEKICILIEDFSLRNSFGNAARIDAAERYNPDVIYKTWDSFLLAC